MKFIILIYFIYTKSVNMLQFYAKRLDMLIDIISLTLCLIYFNYNLSYDFLRYALSHLEN